MVVPVTGTYFLGRLSGKRPVLEALGPGRGGVPRPIGNREAWKAYPWVGPSLRGKAGVIVGLYVAGIGEGGCPIGFEGDGFYGGASLARFLVQL